MRIVLVNVDELFWVMGGGQELIELVWLEGGCDLGLGVVISKNINS